MRSKAGKKSGAQVLNSGLNAQSHTRSKSSYQKWAFLSRSLWEWFCSDWNEILPTSRSNFPFFPCSLRVASIRTRFYNTYPCTWNQFFKTNRLDSQRVVFFSISYSTLLGKFDSIDDDSKGVVNFLMNYEVPVLHSVYICKKKAFRFFFPKKPKIFSSGEEAGVWTWIISSFTDFICSCNSLWG